MLDYFINYSSNAHHICREDSPTRNVYDHTCPMALTFNQGHQCVSNVTIFELPISRTSVCFYIPTWHSGRLNDAIHVDARVHDLELNARWSGSQKAKQSAPHVIGNYKQAICTKLATTVGHFDVTLFLQICIWILFICSLLINNSFPLPNPAIVSECLPIWLDILCWILRPSLINSP